MKRWIFIALGVLVLLAAYPAWLGYQIWDQSRRDEARPADAIVVLGAAQYNGDPSRVFQARLDHAAYLYREGFSNTVIVTGGRAEGDRFTEAEAGTNYLIAEEQVPSTSILQEDRGRTTLQSMKGVKTIADDQGFDSLLLVSDPMHSERIKRMAQDLGFQDAYVSWASYVDLNRSRATKLKELVREIGSIISYELLGR